MLIKSVNVGIIGAGYWGKNLIRVFNALPHAEVRYVCDMNEQRLEAIKRQYPHLSTTTKSEDVFLNPTIDAVLIATPVSSHYMLARRAMQEGKHVWIEKPIAHTIKEAESLIRTAAEKKLTLLVDHTFLYTPAVRKMKQMIEDGELSDLRYLDSERMNLGLIQPDVNVVYDLAVHDISIFNYLVGATPIAVNAAGASHLTRRTKRPLEEIAFINLHYPNNVMGHIRVSWISPVKLRKMLVGGSKKMVLFDDVEPVEKLKVYNHNVEINFENDTTFEPIYRSGDVLIPHLEHYEALQKEAEHFIECIHERKRPLTDGANGLAALKVVDAANRSMKKEGKRISIS